jgi:hypothetical protein
MIIAHSPRKKTGEAVVADRLRLKCAFIVSYYRGNSRSVRISPGFRVVVLANG